MPAKKVSNKTVRLSRRKSFQDPTTTSSLLTNCLKSFIKLSYLLPVFPIQWDKSTNLPIPAEHALLKVKSGKRKWSFVEMLVLTRGLILLYNILPISRSTKQPVHFRVIYLFTAGVVFCASSMSFLLRRRVVTTCSILRAWIQLDSNSNGTEQTSKACIMHYNYQ
jgi:hypothetical protein